MQPSRLVTAILLLLLIGCEQAPSLRPISPDAVILAFGDSLTHGTGAPAGSAYPKVLSELLGRPVINAGVPGEVSAAGLERLPGLLLQHRPQLVVLLHGGNDLLRRHDPEQTAANLRAMVAAVREAGADPVLLGVPRPTLLLRAEPFYREIAREAGIPYDGDAVADILSASHLKSDPIHPNAEGYRRLAAAVHRLITGGSG